MSERPDSTSKEKGEKGIERGKEGEKERERERERERVCVLYVYVYMCVCASLEDSSVVSQVGGAS